MTMLSAAANPREASVPTGKNFDVRHRIFPENALDCGGPAGNPVMWAKATK